jgi:hypothetical protein
VRHAREDLDEEVVGELGRWARLPVPPPPGPLLGRADGELLLQTTRFGPLREEVEHSVVRATIGPFMREER